VSDRVWLAAQIVLMLIAIFLSSLTVAAVELRSGVDLPWGFSGE
jgi:hypothetical protein